MRFVWDFAASPPDVSEHLGVRGRMMSELTESGVPAPPGFTVSDVACRRFLESGELPDEMWLEVEAALARLRAQAPADRPLLLAVRSSPPVPMPGILGRALHIGIEVSDASYPAGWGPPGFDAAMRIEFLRGLATIRKVPAHRVDAILGPPGVARSPDLLAEDVAALRDLIVEESQRAIPASTAMQLREGIEAVFASWDAETARKWRRRHDLSDDLGTSVIVHMMVFGSAGNGSGAGSAFSRDPETGTEGVTGSFELGSERPPTDRAGAPAGSLDELDPETLALLVDTVRMLDATSRDMVRIDFVSERRRLWLLDARPGERSARAAVEIAVDLAKAGVIHEHEALMRVHPDALEEMLHDRLAPAIRSRPLIIGAPASPGAAVGAIVFAAPDAVSAASDCRDVVLVRRETTPEDLAGVIAAKGVLTSHGGGTSHAAVAARGTGTPAVTGAANVVVDAERGLVTIGGRLLREGDMITIDGTSGAVYEGVLPLERATASAALDTLLGWADQVRRLEVWANADRPDAAARAREMGAEGIGLARTEYMFSGDRLAVVRQIILTDDAKERARALEELEDLQIGDFERLLESMDGLAVVVRLLDPPLHEFLPDRREIEQARRRERAIGADTGELDRLEAAIDQWEESNPMLGLRGVRLAVVIPEIYRVQVLAALEAVRRRLDAGGDPRLELMIPFVGAVEELHLIRDMIDEEVHYAGRQLEVTVGTMIELPRAAIVAADLALQSDFFSFGTNDLTQTTLGISRDDAEEAFLRAYLDQGLMRRDPFVSIDRQGVGRLIETAITEGLRVNPGLVVGVCGEHGGDPDSIDFFHNAGVDYVSCSPPRIPVARLAAAQAALRSGG